MLRLPHTDSHRLNLLHQGHGGLILDYNLDVAFLRRLKASNAQAIKREQFTALRPAAKVARRPYPSQFWNATNFAMATLMEPWRIASY